MAYLIEAIRAYGPRLALNPTARLDEVVLWMAMRTGLNKSEVLLVLQELSEAIVYFNRQGAPVKLPAIGTFSPSISRAGRIQVNLRADKELKNSLNSNRPYAGKIVNRRHIGLSDQEYKALWDAAHPTDPLLLPGPPAAPGG